MGDGEGKRGRAGPTLAVRGGSVGGRTDGSRLAETVDGDGEGIRGKREGAVGSGGGEIGDAAKAKGEKRRLRLRMRCGAVAVRCGLRVDLSHRRRLVDQPAPVASTTHFSKRQPVSLMWAGRSDA